MDGEFYIYDGKLHKITENFTNINNRAILYGDGCFESIIAYRDQIPLLSLHLKRLRECSSVLNLDLPDELHDDEIFYNYITYLARKNKFYKTYKARITVFRHYGGLYRPTNNKASFIIQTQKISQDKFQLNSIGLSVDLLTNFTKDFSPISKFKTINALQSVIGQIYAQHKNLDDVVFLNHNNNIVETTNSNIFVVTEDEQILTPPVEDGCVDGIMRKFLIKNLSKINLNVTEKQLTTNDLDTAREFFLTNAVRGVQYVLRYRHRRYYNNISQKIVDFLNKELFR